VELIEAEHRSAERDPEQQLLDKRAARLVQAFCDGLSEKLRDVFVLSLLEGQPAPVVGEILNLPEDTVYSRVRLVRAAFRKQLDEHNSEHAHET
jgi:RNA polymerase sigma-70 factor (ECF subfamily)